MSTASSSSSRHGTRRNIIGVPTRCWCGQNIQPFVSETKENPCRRFYRCEIAIKRKTESHLFKWEDEAFLDEIRMVDAKCQNLVHDFQNLSKNVHLELQTHKQWFSQTGEELSAKLQDNFIKMKAQVDSSVAEATKNLKHEFHLKLKPTNQQLPNRPLHSFALAVAVLGAASFFYWKLA